MNERHPQGRGFSMVEVLVVSAVMLLFFAGLFTLVTYMLDVLTNARVRLSALSLAQERVEYIRSLSYDAVGTVAGVPPGAIPQNRTTSLNNYTLYERVLIQYVDDDADGVGAIDSNGIVADYKQVKVEISWNVSGATSSIALISNIVPRSIETTAGGGTIRVNVVDAFTAPLPGASVRLLNTSGTSTIDITRLTDATGVALFAGAPAGSNYQIFVTDTGYSTDQTYVATTSNPNPVTPTVSVLESDVSTMNFQIDRLATLRLKTYSSITEQTVIEDFADMTGVASATAAGVVAGELVLNDTAGVYESVGSVYLNELTPTTLERWEVFSIATELPPGTSVLTRFYTGTTTPTLIPESDLPGNAAGFDARVINVRDLSVTTYPALVVGLTLRTANTTLTPQVLETAFHYRETSTLRAGTAFSLRGTKVIGSDAFTQPIYKTSVSGSVDGSGSYSFNNIEWDTYTLTLPSFTIAAACGGNPLGVAPGSTSTYEVLAVNAPADNLRVSVVDGTGVPVPVATVELRRGAFSETDTADACGQTFFSSGIAPEPDYELEVSAPGFTASTINPVAINGDTSVTVTLTP
ncbi:carboxypeptidase-like regulatory domain-containing protein [Patescibacteria group bacterium]|nr:carboxypeptidase-like regulatory domain-containing protein [Patescibacteria group bacterium]